MARIRTIKPEALQHRKIGRLSDRAFRVWVGMLTQADDEGRLVADSGWFRVIFFGYHPKVMTDQVESSLHEICALGLVKLYTVNGTRYAYFPGWSDHQFVNRPKPSKLPSYKQSLIDHGSIDEQSLIDHGSIIDPSLIDHGSINEDQGSRIKDQGSEGIEEGGTDQTQAMRDFDPDIGSILIQCPNLELLHCPESLPFWQKVLSAAGEYQCDNTGWLGGRIRAWDQYFTAKPHKRSRKRQYLEARLLRWLNDDLEKESRRK